MFKSHSQVPATLGGQSGKDHRDVGLDELDKLWKTFVFAPYQYCSHSKNDAIMGEDITGLKETKLSQAQ